MGTTSRARMPDGLPVGDGDLPIGGQAVLEGVMMRGASVWALAIRARHGGIEVSSEPVASWARRHRVLRWPVVRGVVALAESLKIGFRALQIAALAQTEDDPQEVGRGTWAIAIAGALTIAIGLFFVVPVALTSLIKDWLGSAFLFWLVEGILRTGIFVGYIVAITRLPDLFRLFQYHGAEHKAISCYEAGAELKPENAARFSRYHPRCGTSFLLVVMVLAVFVLAPVGLPEWYWLVASRVLGIPLIAGVAYEAIKWAGKRRDRAWVRAAMWPGLALQGLTTREPDREQLEVAIAALEEVLAVERVAKVRGERIEIVA